jgi:hypothetical protein
VAKERVEEVGMVKEVETRKEVVMERVVVE